GNAHRPGVVPEGRALGGLVAVERTVGDGRGRRPGNVDGRAVLAGAIEVLDDQVVQAKVRIGGYQETVVARAVAASVEGNCRAARVDHQAARYVQGSQGQADGRRRPETWVKHNRVRGGDAVRRDNGFAQRRDPVVRIHHVAGGVHRERLADGDDGGP